LNIKTFITKQFHHLFSLFNSKSAETFHFAMMLAAATIGPLLIHLGLSTDSYIKIFVFQKWVNCFLICSSEHNDQSLASVTPVLIVKWICKPLFYSCCH